LNPWREGDGDLFSCDDGRPGEIVLHYTGLRGSRLYTCNEKLASHASLLSSEYSHHVVTRDLTLHFIEITKLPSRYSISPPPWYPNPQPYNARELKKHTSKPSNLMVGYTICMDNHICWKKHTYRLSMIDHQLLTYVFSKR